MREDLAGRVLDGLHRRAVARGAGGAAPAVSPSSGETFATVAVAGPGGRRRRGARRGRGPGRPGRPARRSSARPGASRSPRRSPGGARTWPGRSPRTRASRWWPRPTTRSTSWPSTSGWRPRTRGAPDGGFPPSTSAGRRVITARVPLGVVGVISPWNWPYTMGAELFAPALAAGNTVVWVPAPTTTACCALLAEIIAGTGRAGRGVQLRARSRAGGRGRAGRPPGRGRRWASSGSVATGGLVAARAAGKTQLLELGGNGPMVILEDADLELAAEAALEAAYLCAGPELHGGRAVPGARRGARRVHRAGGGGHPGSGSGWATRSTRRPRWAR